MFLAPHFPPGRAPLPLLGKLVKRPLVDGEEGASEDGDESDFVRGLREKAQERKTVLGFPSL